MTSAEFLDRLRVTTEFLEAIVGDRGLLAQASPEDQRRLLQAAGQVYAPDANARRQLVRASVRRRKAERVRREDQVLDQTGIRTLRRRPVITTPNVFPPAGFEPATATAIRTSGKPSSRNTATCAKRSTRSCTTSTINSAPTCAAFNFAKRTERADLRGRVALLTGGRVKIGYQAGLKLLRSGAHLIVTTRFPRDSADRYAAEPDFGDWGHRLEIFGLDLRHTPSVEAFCRELIETRDRLDFIINNACQTVRRPPAFYEHMMDREREAFRGMPAQTRRLLGHYEGWRETAPGAGGCVGHHPGGVRTTASQHCRAWRTRPSCPRSGFCRRSIRSRPISFRKAAWIRISSRSTSGSTIPGGC